MPIIAATIGVKFGTGTKLAMSSTIASPMPIPTTAIRTGRPMAITDPKAISRMNMAARMPAPSDPPPPENSAFWMRLPLKANVTPFPLAFLAASIIAVPSDFCSWKPGLSSCTSPNAIVRSGEMLRAPCGE